MVESEMRVKPRLFWIAEVLCPAATGGQKVSVRSAPDGTLE